MCGVSACSWQLAGGSRNVFLNPVLHRTTVAVLGPGGNQAKFARVVCVQVLTCRMNCTHAW